MMRQATPGEWVPFDSDRGHRLAEPHPGQAQKPRLLDRVRLAIRSRNLSPRTEEAYVGWVRKYILFHGKRHPADLGEEEIARFLSSLAAERRVSASTQNQALSALLFLYQQVLHKDLEWLQGIVRARRPTRVPVVLTRSEVEAILANLSGVPWLMASLLYGAGLRLMECCCLRVKDIDLTRNEITIREGKGLKDRVTLVPGKLREPLAAHLERVQQQHRRDVQLGHGSVELPGALARKYRNAPREWGWQWVFPATRLYLDRTTGDVRRHHLHESVLQRSVKEAIRKAGIAKRASCHTLRHYAESRIMPRVLIESSIGAGSPLENSA